MPTINQLIRKGREKVAEHVQFAYSAGLPAKARRVPEREDDRRPRSRIPPLRKIARIRLTNSIEGTCYIPGIGHNLQEH